MSPQSKLRIVILFALRYQKTKANDIANLITLMLENGVSRDDAKVGVHTFPDYHLPDVELQLVYVVLNIAGADQRQDDLFSTETLLAKGFSALKGLKVNITLLSS